MTLAMIGGLSPHKADSMAASVNFDCLNDSVTSSSRDILSYGQSFEFLSDRRAYLGRQNDPLIIPAHLLQMDGKGIASHL